jgi:hypothetical protein
VRAQVYNYTIRERSMEEEEEENLPSPEIPVQPPNYRSTGTTAQLPPNYRSTFCNRAVQDRYSPGCSPSVSLTGTTGPATGTTAPYLREHLQKPVPELIAVQPLTYPVQPVCLRAVKGSTTRVTPNLPLRGLRLYRLLHLHHFRVSKYDSSFVCELCSYLPLLLIERETTTPMEFKTSM